MLQPKKTKHKKEFRPRFRREAKRGKEVKFGEYGLTATTQAWVTNRQIEAARVAMTRYMNRIGKVWIMIYPSRPFTKKPLEVRMGSGKGNVEGWIAVVDVNRVMFEVGGVDEATAREALRLASHKLPVKTKFVRKADQVNEG